MVNETPLPITAPDSEAATAMWRDYVAAHPAHTSAESPTIEAFGDSASVADTLLHLVMHGPKRATASLVIEYTEEGDALPRIGGHWVVCDGSGHPRIIVRTTELRISDFASVDAAFAWDEGEGDRSLEEWRAGHSKYWERTRAARGELFDRTSEIVLERFRVVWPPEFAD